jgi:type VI protein secretion system component Hcp
MTDELKNLVKALTEKAETEKFLSNLEKLKADGSVTPDMYPDMKAEYEQRLKTAANEVERIKNELMKQLSAKNFELEAYQQELKKLEVKHKVGELSAENFRNAAQKIQDNIERLNKNRKGLIKSINARSATDVPYKDEKALPPPSEPPLPAPELKPAAPAMVKKAGGKLSGKKRLAIIGGIAVLVCIVLVVVFLIPREQAEIVIPVEIENAANVGSIYFELVYDDSSLIALGVDDVVSGEGVLIEYNIDAPGRILVAMISSSGITGDMPIVIVRFQPQGKKQQLYKFGLENAKVYDGASLNKLSVSTEPGDFTPKDKSFMPPRLVLAPR